MRHLIREIGNSWSDPLPDARGELLDFGNGIEVGVEVILGHDFDVLEDEEEVGEMLVDEFVGDFEGGDDPGPDVCCDDPSERDRLVLLLPLSRGGARDFGESV